MAPRWTPISERRQALVKDLKKPTVPGDPVNLKMIIAKIYGRIAA
jgi:hypothetical protein